ncbi:MAG: hypothetical protein IPK20_22435 [Betaproteobacteria bacterium]|nr:hypothetical protein [Betaproteobacteria bacterium]
MPTNVDRTFPTQVTTVARPNDIGRLRVTTMDSTNTTGASATSIQGSVMKIIGRPTFADAGIGMVASAANSAIETCLELKRIEI